LQFTKLMWKENYQEYVTQELQYNKNVNGD